MKRTLDLAPPPGGWPDWLWTAPYDGSQHPQAEQLGPIARGSNCQRYAYALLALYGRSVPALWSSDLWDDPSMTRVDADGVRPLDLVLVNDVPGAYAAHVGVHVGDDAVLHLCAEANRPEVWTYAELASRDLYRVLVGRLRAPGGGQA